MADDTLKQILTWAPTLIYMALGFYASYLSWTCNTVFGTGVLMKCVYAFFAYWLNLVYLVFYFFMYYLSGSVAKETARNLAKGAYGASYFPVGAE